MRIGIFRVDKEVEIVGLDIAEMGGVDEEVYERIRNHSFFINRAESHVSNSPYILPKEFIKRERQRSQLRVNASYAAPGDVNNNRASSNFGTSYKTETEAHFGGHVNLVDDINEQMRQNIE